MDRKTERAILAFVLAGLVAWAGRTLWEHEKRLVKIETDWTYMHGDAHAPGPAK